MLGGIIGDIVGSVYEFANIKTKEFDFFTPRMTFTDDSVLSFATAQWLLEGGTVSKQYCDFATRYPFPTGGYGGSFVQWIKRAQQGLFAPYNSCGNGSAMRVGPVGWAFETLEETLEAAKQSAECTHNHPEGIKGAQVTAMCIFMARKGAGKPDIRKAVESMGYDLNMTCDELRKEYAWDSRWGNGGICQASVPQAIVCFLEGDSFEDCVRNAISIGGDSDTIGCITGSIAEAFYGIPRDIRNTAVQYLDEPLRQLLDRFEQKYGAY